MEQDQAIHDDQPRGPREVKPVQFFGDNVNGALGVTKGADFRPIVSKSEDADVNVTHTFQAEPGEPGVPEGPSEQPDGVPPIEAPSTGENDSPEVTGPEPEQPNPEPEDPQPAAEQPGETKSQKARNTKE